MARELHDGVCNDLLAIEMNLRKGIDSCGLLKDCRESVRRISHELMPPEFTYANIDEVLRYFVSKQNNGDVKVSYASTSKGANWKSVPENVALENISKFSNAMQLVNELDTGKSYDFYIIDLELPDIDGFVLIEMIRSRQPVARIIVSTVHDEI